MRSPGACQNAYAFAADVAAGDALGGASFGGAAVAGSTVAGKAEDLAEQITRKFGDDAAAAAARAAHEATESRVAQNTIAEALSAPSQSVTAGGFLSKQKVCDGGCAVDVVSDAEKALVQRIVDHGDQTGVLTEELVEHIAKREGLISLRGTKYGSNNGFDHVLQSADGAVTIILDAKQIYGGTIQLGSTKAGVQLSDDWIDAVLGKIGPTPAEAAIQQAIKNGTLRIAVAGVNKQTSELVMVNINRW